ncbi:MAG: GTP-binding protein [Parafilimonas sp.]
MQIHLISGFLGSGKSTAIKTACKVLQSTNKKVGVITNDQGIKLVDTGYFESNAIPNRQVINGCFCCNYNLLDENIQSLIETNNPDIIFAESVGSCTDIIATIMKPLLQFKKDISVTVSTFADVRLLQMLFIQQKPLFNDEVHYIYKKQLEEAQNIIVSKIDLISKKELDAVQQLLQKEYADKRIIYINGTDNKSILQWLDAINKAVENNKPSSLNIDYEIYGAGEAMLAWLDAELRIYSSNNNAKAIALKLTQNIYKNIQAENLSIGHLKFLIDDNIKISYTATFEKAITNQFKDASSALVLVNARIQATPEFLGKLVDKVIQQTETQNDCKIIKESYTAFKPGFPKPAYRIAE